MNVSETLNDGLKRELTVVIPATDLETQLMDRLTEIKGKIRLNGFRPGKVPVAHLRKVYGKSVMAEVIEKAVQESSQQAVEDRGEKPAFQPDIKLPEEQAEVERVLDGKADLSYSMAFEVLPEFEVMDLSSLKLEKEIAAAEEADITEAVERIAKQSRPFTPKAEGANAEKGDRVAIDYTGYVDGEAFEGGSDTDADLELGANQFIPGFEDQLVGAKADDDLQVKVTFPEEYPAKHLAGKDASFEVKVKSVSAPGELKIDDDFAKTLGMDSLDALKDAIRSQIEAEYQQATRSKVKRKLLDQLEKEHVFDLPPTLVDKEFESIWRQVTADLERANKTFEDEETTEEEAKEEYRGIAERRVRLGLVLGKVGEKADVSVSEEELQRAVVERARQFPGQEQQVWEYYRNNPSALIELRAPIFEEKTVDYILELADVTEKTVSKDDLLKDDDDADGKGPAV